MILHNTNVVFDEVPLWWSFKKKKVPDSKQIEDQMKELIT